MQQLHEACRFWHGAAHALTRRAELELEVGVGKYIVAQK
jgi:hypothetical protein